MPPRLAAQPDRSARGAHTRLEKRLVLLAWLHSHFGFGSTPELLQATRDAQEGFDPDGRSYLSQLLLSRGDRVQIAPEVLASYDENIRAHLMGLNARRPEPITLRYFQYLAALYTEVFLDWYFNRPGELVRRLNEFVARRNAERLPGDPEEAPVTTADLTKFACWMATGSGKTLVMHLNYRQFLHYNRRPLDNILLIAPNEALGRQHLVELEASGIPGQHFSLEESGLGLGGEHAVRVIEITKLVEEKRGSGVTVPVEAFEGNNLIFVDEGHKGSGGEAWRRFRDALGRTGFTFEYSATFGQALTAARDDALTSEYGRAIGFDYSYRYFYGDGFGKDFRILNLREETAEEKTDILLLGNLLAFYEQLRYFSEQAAALRPYNLEQPLWVFVGSSVNAVYRESGQPRSDVLTVVRFLQRFLANRRGWVTRAIGDFLKGRSGLLDGNGEDVFARRFEYLRRQGREAERIYRDILGAVFRAPGGGNLHLVDIRSSAGEIGLKLGGVEDYFGVINIGDTASFRRLVEADGNGIPLEEDAISPSLFDRINEPRSGVSVLIGAKKFMEGWNSWRVSSMGLLNIGRAEGSEIIQLFGRGVRLRGRGFTLKRSAALDGLHPRDLRLLETLDIFAVRANYMAQFRDYLEREGVEATGYAELPLAIRPNREFLGQGLVVPRLAHGRDFAREVSLMLAADPAARVRVDISLRVQTLRSAVSGLQRGAAGGGSEQVVPRESLDVIHWDALYLRLLEYKEQRGLHNLVIRPDALRRVLENEGPRLYQLIADEGVVRPTTFGQAAALEEAALAILRKYIERFYYVRRERWESRHMTFVVMDRGDANFRDYTVRIARTDRELIAAVKRLIDEGNRIYREEVAELPNVHFDRHLYQPVLLTRSDRITSDPPGLNASEERFVRDLRRFLRDGGRDILRARDVYLLRNLSRGRGIGFFESEGFYPDFVLWVKEGDHQRIVFVEPHGMRHEKTYWTNERARLHERLQEQADSWGEAAGLRHVTLDSFIVSAAPYDELRLYYGDGWSQDDFAKRHILFFGSDGGYVAELFAAALADRQPAD